MGSTNSVLDLDTHLCFVQVKHNHATTKSMKECIKMVNSKLIIPDCIETEVKRDLAIKHWYFGCWRFLAWEVLHPICTEFATTYFQYSPLFS